MGSGVGAPDLVELLGSLYPPTEFLDPTPPLSEATPLLGAQKRFYDALTSGDVEAMKALFSDSESPAVQRALDAGARLDVWASQLADDARPKDLLVGDADETDFGDTAITTAVEATPGGGSMTLLAVQRWTKDANGDWKLLSHETIPYAMNNQAGAVLKCDARGCVALVRGQRGRS